MTSNKIVIKVSLETLRSKLTVKAEFVAINNGGRYLESKRVAYQATKPFKDNCIIAARMLCAEHGIACQNWQVNFIECAEQAYFTNDAGIVCIIF